MKVLIANNTGAEARRLAAAFPGRVGHLLSPGGWRRPSIEFPYAIDNGAFAAWLTGEPFDDGAFLKLLNRVQVATIKPMWIAVPDVVADHAGTLASWERWRAAVAMVGAPLAFVVQDGIMAADVPSEASVIFVGGTTAWKWSTLPMWCDQGRRVHVGRVNTPLRLRQCADLGVESCDGTGYFRGSRRQLDALWYFLADAQGTPDPTHGPLQRRLALGR